MFRKKICGITRNEDILAARRLGVDAVGFNFYPKSSRFLPDMLASKLDLQDIGYMPLRIGVFVNADLETIRSCADRYSLSGIQLHGDEPPEMLAALPELPLVRARRMDDRGVDAIAEDVRACSAAGRAPDALLVDAYSPSAYGGTGETVAWSELSNYQEWLGNIPLILAGGLTPDNVAEAIRTVRPYGVDTASGVESSPGVKDHGKMQSFLQQANAAFAQIDAE